MSRCVAPGCEKDASVACAECRRDLCGWHFALRPLYRAKDLKPVCLPECASDYWQGQGPSEVSVFTQKP